MSTPPRTPGSPASPAGASNHGPVPSSSAGPTAAERVVRPALLLAGILLLAANMRGALTVVSPLTGQIRDDLGLSSVTVSALISLPLLCFAAVSPLIPKLAARSGIERTLTAGLAVLMVGIVLRSVPREPGLWLGTVLVGASIASINVLLPALLKRDFPQRIGPLTGIYNGVQSLFAAFAAGLAVPLAGLPGWGWRTAIGSTVAIAAIGLAVMLPQARRAVQHRPARSEVEGPVEFVEDEARRPRPLWRQPMAWYVTLFMGGQSCLFYSVLTWWPSVEHEDGYTAAAAGLHMAILQAAGIIGSLSTGALLKRVGPRIMTAIPVPVTMLGIAGQLVAPQLAPLWAVVIGMGTGGNIVAALALFGARTRTHARAAELSGMAQSIGYLFAACVPPLLGFLHDASGGWTVPLLVLLCFGALAAVSAGLAARDRVIE